MRKWGRSNSLLVNLSVFSTQYFTASYNFHIPEVLFQIITVYHYEYCNGNEEK